MTGPACGASVRESRREGASRWSPPSVRTLQLLEDPLDGDLHPIRPVVELVPQLVQGLLQEMDVQESADLPAARWKDPRHRGDLQIAPEEGARHPLVPKHDPGLEERGVLLEGRPAGE